MEFGGTSKPVKSQGSDGRAKLFNAVRRHTLKVEESSKELKEMYPDNLNFYMVPPSCSISLPEFEQYAVERLKILRLIERINCTTEQIRGSGQYYEEIRTALRKNSNELPTFNVMLNTMSVDSAEEVFLARRIDHISHFLLRLAFCRTDELRKWFISLEIDFFRFRMNCMSPNKQSLTKMLKRYNLPVDEFETNDTNERMEIENGVRCASWSTDTNATIFKVVFLHALDLIRSRNVLLKDGYAYVPFPELSNVISLKFRSYLSESLSLLKKNIHLVEDDERLRPLVVGFEKRYLGTDTSQVKSTDKVSMADLNTFSEKSFPLCMKHLYDVVQKDHHLKHGGRLQLGLFFKGLGLPIDESIKFWRNNFTKRPEIDSSRFDKQYLYNIRHSYGQEGKRTDYTPYHCMKIITSVVGAGDHHGCPFRHCDATPLRTKMLDAGISQDGIREILKLVEDKHYQIACQKYFEYTHDKHTVDGGVHHPNQYFLESRNVLTGKKTIKNESKVETTRVLMYSQSQSGTQKNEPVETDENGFPMDEDADEALSAMEQMEY